MSSLRTETLPPPSSRSPTTNPAWMTLISGVLYKCACVQVGKTGTGPNQKQNRIASHQALWETMELFVGYTA